MLQVEDYVLKFRSVSSPCSRLQSCVVFIDLVVLKSPWGKNSVVLVDVAVHDSVVMLSMAKCFVGKDRFSLRKMTASTLGSCCPACVRVSVEADVFIKNVNPYLLERNVNQRLRGVIVNGLQ